MLERAAPANAEVSAWWNSPRRPLLDHFDKATPLSFTAYANNVAWNCAGNEQSVLGHPVAGVAEFHDFDDFAGFPRLLGHKRFR
jgi:hypothetical protein